jgi:hypothetical protein
MSKMKDINKAKGLNNTPLGTSSTICLSAISMTPKSTFITTSLKSPSSKEN